MPHLLDQDVTRNIGLTTFPYGKSYTWEIEKRLGLPKDSIFKLKVTTKRFAEFLLREGNIIGEVHRYGE